MTPNQMLPQLPSLGRPSWAPAGMSAETIADIQSRPDQLRRYRSGASRQINFSGSLLPQPPGLTGGEVFADGSVPGNGLGGGNGNYQPIAGIPGTASNWTVDNPNPNTPRPPGAPMDGPGGANVPDVQARTPWFSKPFQQQYQEDVPYYMKGIKRG